MSVMGELGNMVEKNPKVAAGVIGGLVLLNVASLSISGIYVKNTKKEVAKLTQKVDTMNSNLSKLFDGLEMLDDEDEDDTEDVEAEEEPKKTK